MALVLFVLGLIIGSFLSSYTYRLPRGRTIIKGRSICPSCKKKIHWYDNLPLLSYLLLKGKCRNCGKKISIRYPLIELTTGLGFVGVWFLSDGFVSLLFWLFLFSLLLAIFVIDLEAKIIPDELIFAGFIASTFFLLVVKPSDFYIHLFSGFVAASFLLLVHILTRGRGMRLGDVKFALFGGILLGWPLSLVWLFGAFLTGALVGSILILAKKTSFGKQIAFGPFLVLSLIIVLIWGENLFNLLF